MKRFNKLICFLLVFVTVMATFCTVSFAATVGQPLTSPEAGWQRIDDTNDKFVYSGDGWDTISLDNSYNKTLHYLTSNPTNPNASLNFKFYGSKLRLIGARHTEYTTDLTCKIDGSEYQPINLDGSTQYQLLLFEVSGLELKEHTVSFYSKSDLRRWHFDALDIDTTGYLIDYYSPTNLTAVPGNTNVELSWDEVEGATSYIVKRSETPGGPYETITTTAAITYTDRDVINGTTYYYVVTALVNNIESDPSNEASATPNAPTDPEPSGNNAILEITIVTGEIKEYDLTAAELQTFLTWYDGRSNGTDKAYYMIPKKNNIKPFLSRKEYIAFDKISSFEVKEYTE